MGRRGPPCTATRRRTGGQARPVLWLPVDVRVGAYGVIIADDQILLTHWNEHGRTGWTLPGGGLEEYETPQQAAVREVREETGFDTEILDILGVDSMYVVPADRIAGQGPLHVLRIVFRARIVGGSLTHEIGGSSDEARWVPLTEVAALPTVSLVGIALQFPGHRG
jgi:8-oxo-dGTP diphosphatase